MDPVQNPYAPGAGRPPAALVGRDLQIGHWLVGLDRVEAGRTAQSLVLYGLRGVGKTVLLNRFFEMAESRDWIVAQVEAGSGKQLREALGEALHAPLADLARPSAGKRLLKGLKTALSFKASYDTGGTWNFGIDLTETAGGGADTGVLETDLLKLISDLSGAAAEQGVGLAVLIDEAQDLSADELVAVCSVAHQAGQHGRACLFALAGLPSLPGILAEAKSYAERLFSFERIEELDGALAKEAIVVPARDEGVVWDADAVDFTVAQTGGYPYFLQQFGQDIWNEAHGPTISLTDARVGSQAALRALDNGFYRARWDRATPAEKRYLRAMADAGVAGSSSGEVAARLGGPISKFGPIRAKLIAKGLIYAPEHGRVDFTVPGMADFISRQPA